MIKSILFELVRRNMFAEKKNYSNCFANVFAIGSFVVLVAANYLYFYLADKDIGDLVMYSGILLFISLILKTYNYCWQRKESHSILPLEIEDVVKKITTHIPLILRYVPISLLTFVAVSLIKNKVLSESRKLIK